MTDALRRAIRTAIQTFVAVFSVTLLGFLSSVQEWAGGTAAFPSVSLLGKAAVAAVAAAASGLVSYVMNHLEDTVKVFPAYLKATPSAGLNPVTEDPAVNDPPPVNDPPTDPPA